MRAWAGEFAGVVGEVLCGASHTRAAGLALSASRPGSTLVAGSLRSFPQDSWSSFQSTRVKRMIRRSGDETSSTHSQTLNRVVAWVA